MRELRLGWLLAALVLLVWPAALLHEATTVHAICPEHGERLDVAEGGAAGELPAQHEGEEEREPGAGDADGEHDECPLVLLAQLTDAGAGGPSPCVRLAETGAAPPSGSTVALASIPLLLLAPKQSPPV